ncbi:MAG: hypothetical protein KTR28_04430 [Micavibrio sp.]|nr:hypothetical protein [Micavibrio sp.]
MSTQLPMDANGHPIPALKLKSGGAHQVNITATSLRNSSAFGENTRVVSIYATSDSYVKFGDNTVTATSSDHFFPAGLYYDVALGGENSPHFTHISALRSSADGVLYISEKE